MIVRRKEYAKREPSRDAHKIYIVCEGKGTEPAYFSFFEGLSSNLQLITIPPDEGTDPLKLMERAKDILLGENRKYTIDYRQGDSIWFVIDTDTWEKEGKIVPLRGFCSSQNEEIPKQYDEVKMYSAWNVRSLAYLSAMKISSPSKFMSNISSQDSCKFLYASLLVCP